MISVKEHRINAVIFSAVEKLMSVRTYWAGTFKELNEVIKNSNCMDIKDLPRNAFWASLLPRRIWKLSTSLYLNCISFDTDGSWDGILKSKVNSTVYIKNIRGEGYFNGPDKEEVTGLKECPKALEKTLKKIKVLEDMVNKSNIKVGDLKYALNIQISSNDDLQTVNGKLILANKNLSHANDGMSIEFGKAIDQRNEAVNNRNKVISYNQNYIKLYLEQRDHTLQANKLIEVSNANLIGDMERMDKYKHIIVSLKGTIQKLKASPPKIVKKLKQETISLAEMNINQMGTIKRLEEALIKLKKEKDHLIERMGFLSKEIADVVCANVNSSIPCSTHHVSKQQLPDYPAYHIHLPGAAPKQRTEVERLRDELNEARAKIKELEKRNDHLMAG